MGTASVTSCTHSLGYGSLLPQAHQAWLLCSCVLVFQHRLQNANTKQAVEMIALTSSKGIPELLVNSAVVPQSWCSIRGKQQQPQPFC